MQTLFIVVRDGNAHFYVGWTKVNLKQLHLRRCDDFFQDSFDPYLIGRNLGLILIENPTGHFQQVILTFWGES